MSGIDLCDIQGMVRSGYARHPHAAYLFFQIPDGAAQAARAALSTIVDELRHGAHDDWHRPRLNLAFGYAAIEALLSADAAATFPREFRLGMDKRDRILGDDPSTFVLGAPRQRLDVLVMCFAPSHGALDEYAQSIRARLGGALELVHQDISHRPRDGAEHFGFRDGISNPAIAGLDNKPAGPERPVPTGEFLLGYNNAYNFFPTAPSLAPAEDPEQFLEESSCTPGRRELGKNGTFLVYRKLEQDVKAFRVFVAEAARARGKDGDKATEAWLAARMVGRWKNGVPTQLSPDNDRGADVLANDFLFGAGRDGTKCPIGSHIRRSNPRDALQPGPEESLQVVERHRILRRGRPYGKPAPDPLPPDDDGDRGIIFLCLNANIERQFEFIQQTWINSAKFDGLYDETDPFVGPRSEGRDKFSIQQKPVRERVCGLGTFVKTLGGGYFFLPSLKVIRFLCLPRD